MITEISSKQLNDLNAILQNFMKLPDYQLAFCEICKVMAFEKSLAGSNDFKDQVSV